MREERRCTPASTVVSRYSIPKDDATQRLISHMAQENYNTRIQLHLPGDELSDWVAAENRYIAIFMRRRNDDR